MAKILLVEDERDLAMLVSDWLEGESHVVEWVKNGLDALHHLDISNYDLMILDLLLPKLGGMEVCRRYRAMGNTMPILILTAKSSIDDKEIGLDAGADDYLTKPFHLKELAARVRVLLRKPSQFSGAKITIGKIVLNSAECTVRNGNDEVHLSPQEYRLLEFLMRHPDQVFSSEALYDRVWESNESSGFDTVRSHIMRLRGKLDMPGQPSLISTVRRLGYKLNSSDA